MPQLDAENFTVELYVFGILFMYLVGFITQHFFVKIATYYKSYRALYKFNIDRSLSLRFEQNIIIRSMDMLLLY